MDYSRIKGVDFAAMVAHFEEHMETLRDAVESEDPEAFMLELAEFHICIDNQGRPLSALAKGANMEEVAIGEAIHYLKDVGILPPDEEATVYVERIDSDEPSEN